MKKKDSGYDRRKILRANNSNLSKIFGTTRMIRL